jgi:hypothetical protein
LSQGWIIGRKSYDGTLEVRKKDYFMILNNAKGKQIGYRFLKSNENLSLGTKIYFSFHIVRIGSLVKEHLIKAKNPCG